MFTKKFATIAVISMSLVLTSCSDDSNADTSYVDGNASKGPVAQAQVTVTAMTSAGARGQVLTTTQTDSQGNFNFELDYEGYAEIVVTGGSYEDEATGNEVAMGSNELKTLVYLSGNKEVAVTALTTIAAARANANASIGLETAIANANAEVAAAFGIQGVDISAVKPADLTVPLQAGIDIAATKYGAVQSGMSQLIAEAQLSAEELMVLVKAMAEDFQDGVFDGKNGSATIEFVLSITPEEAMASLQVAIQNFLTSPRNKSGASF